MVFDFLKKKLQEMGSKPSVPDVAPPAEEPASYEERRGRAEALYAEGKADEAVGLLEELAAELAGAGNFPLAVAVRHQINAWQPAPARPQTPVEAAKKMVRQRAESGLHEAIPDPERAAVVPQGIQQAPLFEGLNADEIAGLIESTGRRSYTSGDVVLEEGKSGSQMYLVTRGLLGVTTSGAAGAKVRVGTLTVGDVFGEVALLTGRPRTATVVAETEAECLEISREGWEGILGRFPRLQKILEEIRETRARLAADAIVDDLRRRRDVPKGS